jgi:HD-GYP domain-containing protein (c-di-GMP phosphodiesterase class II)
LRQPEGEAGAPDLGDPNLTEQERQRSDVVLVRVREDDRPDAVAVLRQVADVREDQIDAEVLVTRKREPGVDDHDLAAQLEQSHVLPDFADAAERDDAQSHRAILGGPPSFKGWVARADLDAMQAVLLFAAALIAAELLHRRDRELGTGDDSDRFSVTAALAAAAAIVLGPVSALLVSTVPVGAVRRLQGDSWRESGVRAISLGAGALAGGFAYILAGSETGSLSLPDDLLGLVVLGVVFTSVKTLLVRLADRAVVFEADVLGASAEVGLAGAVAVAAEANLWEAALLVPVLLLIEQLYGRMIALRREVASALETFANLVDERDPSTYRHSVRVAESMRALAEELGLSKADARRLWWAGRLHDLGKVAVDGSVLRKRGLLTPAEWAAVARAPRLSARLLQRFRFASQQAKAVEYHRERFDGSGYYGADGADIPLAAHFLILADAFDAMISPRSFREPMSREEALAEIEKNAGRQFHPVIAQAFVAVQRGQRADEVIDAVELASIREAPAGSLRSRTRLRDLRQRPESLVLIGSAATLAGLGTALVELAVVGAGAAVLGAGLSSSSRLRAARLGRAVDGALAATSDRATLFWGVADAFAHAWPQDFALLVAWSDDGSGGTVELARGLSDIPPAELTSWLLREAESDRELIVDDGVELGRTGATVALPLRRENSALVGFIVLGGRKYPPSHVLVACRSNVDRIGLALADAPAPLRAVESVAS